MTPVQGLYLVSSPWDNRPGRNNRRASRDKQNSALASSGFAVACIACMLHALGLFLRTPIDNSMDKIRAWQTHNWAHRRCFSSPFFRLISFAMRGPWLAASRGDHGPLGPLPWVTHPCFLARPGLVVQCGRGLLPEAVTTVLVPSTTTCFCSGSGRAVASDGQPSHLSLFCFSVKAGFDF